MSLFKVAMTEIEKETRSEDEGRSSTWKRGGREGGIMGGGVREDWRTGGEASKKKLCSVCSFMNVFCVVCVNNDDNNNNNGKKRVF